MSNTENAICRESNGVSVTRDDVELNEVLDFSSLNMYSSDNVVCAIKVPQAVVDVNIDLVNKEVTYEQHIGTADLDEIEDADKSPTVPGISSSIICLTPPMSGDRNITGGSNSKNSLTDEMSDSGDSAKNEGRFVVPSPKRKRGAKGKFTRKLSGTPQQQFRRKLDRERKQFERTLNTFTKLAISSEFEEKIKYFCLIERENGEVHFSGTDDFIKKFKDNLNLTDFQDSMIESRRTSILERHRKTKAKKEAIPPSPAKEPAADQFSFLPGFSLGVTQKQSLRETMPSLSSGEDLINLNNRLLDIKRRIWVRQNRKKVVVPEMNESEDESLKGRGKTSMTRGRGRLCRGKGKGRGKRSAEAE